MVTIQCKSCGRVYNYRSSELCPKCGAYRLPHRLCKACMTYDGKVFGQVQEN